MAALQVTHAQQNELPTSGNVGINTTNPTEALDVRGGARIDSNITIGDTIKARGAQISEDLTVSGNTLLKSNAEVVQDFSVGGKSTFGNAKIAGTLTLPNVPTSSSMDGTGILILKSDGTIEKGVASAYSEMSYTKQCLSVNGIVSNPTWRNGDNRIFTNCPEVNVGINTDNPQYKLHVRGTGYFGGSIIAGNALPNYATLATFEGLRTANTTTPFMRLAVRKTDGTDELRFKVEANGNVYCTKLMIRLADSIPVPDFVFKPTYKLMPLSEVKSFVYTNSHLPNIPSEAEIRESGLSVDDMQLKLLEKVEELTLYMIELDEKNQMQEKDNAAMKAELERLKLQLSISTTPKQ